MSDAMPFILMLVIGPVSFFLVMCIAREMVK